MMASEIKRVFDCGNCGVSVRRPEGTEACPVCGEDALHAVPYHSGYDEPHMLGIWARADMLERVGSLTTEQHAEELRVAARDLDLNDPKSLRWLAVLVESRLGLLATQSAKVPCPECGGTLGPVQEPPGGGDPWRTCDECGNNIYFPDADAYTPGMRVRFADSTATVSDGVAGVSGGVVNGPPIEEGGRVTHVPVFAKRDNGREETTIYVAIENMLGEVKD